MNLVWNPKFPGISNSDFKVSESCMLLYFVMDPSSMHDCFSQLEEYSDFSVGFTSQ